MNKEEFTKRIRHVVERAGGAQRTADLAEVSHQAVYGWLAGAMPYLNTITLLCGKLGISEKWLLQGIGSEEHHEDTATTTIRTGEPHHPLTQSDRDLAHTLAELIHGFPDLPPAYRRITIEQIENHWHEFRARAERANSTGSTITQFPAPK